MELLKFFKRLFGLGDIKIKKKKLSFINLKWSFLLFFIFLMPFFAFSQVNINTIDTGFRIPKNTASIGTEVDVHLVCKVVKNTSFVNDYFIPTKSAGEWTSFINAVPSITDLVISDCLFCGAGYYLSGGVCVLTSAGYYSPVDNNTIYQCGSNDKYSSVGAGSYTTVTAGYYTTGGTSTTRTGKTICGVGYYCPGPGNGSRYSCPVETTSVTGSDNINDCTSTAACAAGYYLLSSTCTCVGDGYYSSVDDNSRYTCPAGSYCSGCTGTPSICSAGTYSSSGSSSCTTCAAGTYNTTTGNSTCTTCPAGKYCTGGTNLSCCPDGRYRTSTGGTSVSSCTSCASGTYGVGTCQTSNTCASCSAGYYSSTGAASCSSCSAGTYSSSGSSSCSTCSCSTYSSSGSSSCSTGSNGYNCSTGSTSSTANACTSGYL